MAKIFKDNNSVGKDIGATGAWYVADRNKKWYGHFEKQFDSFL